MCFGDRNHRGVAHVNLIAIPHLKLHFHTVLRNFNLTNCCHRSDRERNLGAIALIVIVVSVVLKEYCVEDLSQS